MSTSANKLDGFDPEVMAGLSPIRFPSESDKIREEAAEFRRLSSTERFLQIFGLSAFAELLLKQSPNRDQILSQRLASEEEWQRIHRELFQRHGV